MRGRTDLIDALTKYFEGHIAKHKVNISNLLDNHVVIAEHPDIVETLDKELDLMSSYEDKLSVLKKYFVDKETNTKELLRAIPQPDPLGRDERKKERLASKKISQREI